MARHGTFTSAWCYSLAMFHKDELLKRERALRSQSEGVAPQNEACVSLKLLSEVSLQTLIRGRLNAFRSALVATSLSPLGRQGFRYETYNAPSCFCCSVSDLRCPCGRYKRTATRRNADRPLADRPDTLPPDVTRDTGTIATGHHDDHNITRPRTREDVIRDIFRDRPSGAPDRPKP